MVLGQIIDFEVLQPDNCPVLENQYMENRLYLP